MKQCQFRYINLILVALLFLLNGCSAGAVQPTLSPASPTALQTTVEIQPTPTLPESLTHKEAVRMVKLAVIAEMKIVDPFVVQVTTLEGVGEVLAVSYLSPSDISSSVFGDEMANVIYKATEGFVRADPKLSHLVITSTSVGENPGTKSVAIGYEFAYQWFTRQIDDSAYQSSWIFAQ